MARIKMGADSASVPMVSAAAPPPDSERIAIQSEGASATEKAIQDRMNAAVATTRAKLATQEGVSTQDQIAEAQKALGAGFFGGPPAVVPSSPAPSPTALAAAQAKTEVSAAPPPVFDVGFGDAGEEVTAVHGEELYGKQGTFSQYRVGPFTGRTKVRPGETHADAMRRLKGQLRAEADEERVAAHERFMAHWKKNIATA